MPNELNYNISNKKPKREMAKKDTSPKLEALKDFNFKYEKEIMNDEGKKQTKTINQQMKVRFVRDEQGYVNNIIFKSRSFSFIMINDPTKEGKNKYSYAWFDFKNKQALHPPIKQTGNIELGYYDKGLMEKLIEQGNLNGMTEKFSTKFINELFTYLFNNKDNIIPIKLKEDSIINNPQTKSRLYNPIRKGQLLNPKNSNNSVLAMMMEDWGIKLKIDRLSSEETNPKTTYYMSNGRYYEFKSSIDLLELVNYVYGLNQSVFNRKDIMEALDSVYKRIEKNYDYIAFKNCFVNVKTHKKIDTLTEPVLPYLIHPDINYYETSTNIDEIIKKYSDKEFIQYLKTSLPPEKKEDGTDYYKQMKWAMEILGYAMISGNFEQAIFNVVGLGGTGKSIFFFLVGLVTANKTNACKIAKLCKQDKTDENVEVFDVLATIDADSSGVYIEDRTNLRVISGRDDVRIRGLYHNPFTAMMEEIAIIFIGGNILPVYKKMESADYDRDLYLEYNVKFRGTKNEKKNLKELLEKEKELIINLCLNMYFEHGLSIKKEQSLEEKKQLYEKYSQPLSNALSELVTCNEFKDTTEWVGVKELEDIILEYGKMFNVPLNLNKKGRLKQGTLIRTIRRFFDLDKDYESKKEGNKRVYCYLEPTELYNEILEMMRKEEEDNEAKT